MGMDTRECPACLDTSTVETVARYNQDGTVEAELKCYGCGHRWVMWFNGTVWIARKANV